MRRQITEAPNIVTGDWTSRAASAVTQDLRLGLLEHLLHIGT
jgi:hypothetical protein